MSKRRFKKIYKKNGINESLDVIKGKNILWYKSKSGLDMDIDTFNALDDAIGSIKKKGSFVKSKKLPDFLYSALLGGIYDND